VVAMWLMEGSYTPQIVRLYRVKESYEISLFFPLINLAGRLLVMLYSAAVGESACTRLFGRYNSSYSAFVPDTVLPLEVQAHRIPQKQHFRALREEREYG
jgi:uncharacterized protein with PQ loop repeat